MCAHLWILINKKYLTDLTMSQFGKVTIEIVALVSLTINSYMLLNLTYKESVILCDYVYNHITQNIVVFEVSRLS